MELSIELIAGIVSLIGLTVLTLKRLDLIHFGKPEPTETAQPILASCPDQGCKQEIAALIAAKVDKDPETGGAHHIAHETRTKLALYRPMDLQDAICRSSIAELKGEIKDVIDGRIQAAEDRIIAAVKQNGKG